MNWFGINDMNNTDEIRRKISDLEYKKRSLESDLYRAESENDRAISDISYYRDAENDRSHKHYWEYHDALNRHNKYSREVRNLKDDIWDVKIDISDLEREL